MATVRKDIFSWECLCRDDITGFDQISPVRIKDGQRIFVIFTKTKTRCSYW